MLGDEVAPFHFRIEQSIVIFGKVRILEYSCTEILLFLRSAQSRFEVLVLGAHLIGENLGLVYRWSSPKKFPGVFLDRDPLTSTSAKSLPMLYIYMSILELDKLFLGT